MMNIAANEDSFAAATASIEFYQVEAVLADVPDKGHVRHFGRSLSAKEYSWSPAGAATIEEAIRNWLRSLPTGVSNPHVSARLDGSPVITAKGHWMNRFGAETPVFQTAGEVLLGHDGLLLSRGSAGKKFWRVTYTLDFPDLAGRDEYDLEEVVANALERAK